tara:strand:+ start:3816 stop:4115 length:300 start_codon:yes stop_codon:yes gene_type:complete
MGGQKGRKKVEVGLAAKNSTCRVGRSAAESTLDFLMQQRNRAREYEGGASSLPDVHMADMEADRRPGLDAYLGGLSLEDVDPGLVDGIRDAIGYGKKKA